MFRKLSFLLAGFLALLSVNFAEGQNFPKPEGFVNDFAQVLPEEQARLLELKLRYYAEATSIEVAVATVPSLDGMSVEEYANKLFKQWGVGQKGKDNGVLVLVAPNERKIRIEVGYGLEGDLSDGAGGMIIRDYAIPSFKEKNLAKGTGDTVNAILDHLGEKPYQARLDDRRRAGEMEQQAEREILGFLVALLGLSGIGIPIMFIRARIKRRKELPRLIQKAQDGCENLIDAKYTEWTSALVQLQILKGHILEKEYAQAESEVTKLLPKIRRLDDLLKPLSTEIKTSDLKSLEDRLSRLEGLSWEIRQIFPRDIITAIENKIEERKRAEKSSEVLLDSLPKKIAFARQNKTVAEDEINKAGLKFEQAKFLSQANTVDWLVVYALLTEAYRLLQPPPRPVARRDKDSSQDAGSSHGSSFGGGSSSGGGGFGGGRSGGGGASGSW